MSRRLIVWTLMAPLTLSVFTVGVLGGFTGLQTAVMTVGPWVGLGLRVLTDRR